MRRLLDLVVPQMADTAALVVDAEADARPLIFCRKRAIACVPATPRCRTTLREALQRVVREGLPLERRDVCYPLRIGERTLGALALARLARASRRATW